MNIKISKMQYWTWVMTALTLFGVTASIVRAETYFFEDFERVDAPVPKCWWHAVDSPGKAQLTDERAFSGKHCALIDSGGNGNWEIALQKPLKWSPKDPEGVGNQPLYLSARIFVVGDNAEGHLGFRITKRPKRHPFTGGVPFEDRTQLVAGRTGKWLFLCFDVGQAIHEAEVDGYQNPELNSDHVIFESVAFFTCTKGKYYLDDLQLSTERPEGCTPLFPPPHKLDVAAYYRPDPKLESMVLHGVYNGTGSGVVAASPLHPSSIRSLKRHYVNFIHGCNGCFCNLEESSEMLLQNVERTLDQAAQYDMYLMPGCYIGDRHASDRVKAWDDEKRRTEMLKVVRRLKNKSHLLGWYLEEEWPSERAPICLKQKRWVEEEDPHRSVWSTFNVGPPVAEFGSAYSVVTVDHYPIQGNNPNPSAVPRRIARLVPKFKQPYLLVDQIFAGGSGWTVPTVGQWRLMTYGAMAEGARGFFHFLYSTEPLYRVRRGERLHGGMVDVYGTPSPIYQEIERHLGPDLFSFGELLRTCRPAQVPAEIHMESQKVEDALERELSAIVVRRLTDTNGDYEILGIYSNDPDKTQTGTLHVPKSWLGERIIMDLSAHSKNILASAPIQVKGEPIPIQLAAGDGRFLAVVEKGCSKKLIDRMQSRRLEALRKMVEFDCRWLSTVKVAPAYSPEQWAELQRICDEESPLEALRQVMQLDKANQALIDKSSLSLVMRNLDTARENLSFACKAIEKWAIPREGWPFPPDVEPVKSYCKVQDKLGDLYVHFSDLAYNHTPEALLQPTKELVELCTQHANQLKNMPETKAPNEPCRLTRNALKPLEQQLANIRHPQ